MGVLDRLRGMGLTVPGDISVVGFDDIPTASNSIFSLSTIRQDTAAQAKTAVDALKAIIEGQTKRVRRHVMPVELVLRESSGLVKST
jgi:DNA-binding LacI/PurR family transcriptional regulator